MDGIVDTQMDKNPGENRVETVFFSLGSNLGDREQQLRLALDSLGDIGTFQAVSSLYETEPWGYEDENNYLNIAACYKMTLSPDRLLKETGLIEQESGRSRKRKDDEVYTSRTLDIDILFYGNEILDADGLKIPHPGIQKRKFVLMPLLEIAPDWIHPGLSLSVKEMMKQLKDDSRCEKISNRDWYQFSRK